jgi:hypothetical protein
LSPLEFDPDKVVNWFSRWKNRTLRRRFGGTGGFMVCVDDDVFSISEMLVEPLSLVALAAYLREMEVAEVFSGLEESDVDDTPVGLDTNAASSDKEAKFGGAFAGSLFREPAGDPGTEGKGVLVSFNAGDRASAFTGSSEPRRLLGRVASPLMRLALDRLWLAYDNVRVSRPGLLAADEGYTTFVNPAPSAKMSTVFVV